MLMSKLLKSQIILGVAAVLSLTNCGKKQAAQPTIVDNSYVQEDAERKLIGAVNVNSSLNGALRKAPLNYNDVNLNMYVIELKKEKRRVISFSTKNTYRANNPKGLGDKDAMFYLPKKEEVVFSLDMTASIPAKPAFSIWGFHFKADGSEMSASELRDRHGDLMVKGVAVGSYKESNDPQFHTGKTVYNASVTDLCLFNKRNIINCKIAPSVKGAIHKEMVVIRPEGERNEVAERIQVQEANSKVVETLKQAIANQKNEMTAQAELNSKEITARLAQIAKLEADLAKVTKDDAEAAKKFQAEITKLKSEVGNLMKSNADAAKEITARQAQITALEAKLVQVAKVDAEAAKKLNAEITQLKAELVKVMKSSAETATTLQAQINQLDQERATSYSVTGKLFEVETDIKKLIASTLLVGKPAKATVEAIEKRIVEIETSLKTITSKESEEMKKGIQNKIVTLRNQLQGLK